MHIDDSFGTHELYSSKVLGITKQNIETADLMVYINGESDCSNGGCLLGIAGCLGCVCDTEIGDSSSRNWQVYKPQYWGRHNANWWTGNLLNFAYVSYNSIDFISYSILNCFNLFARLLPMKLDIILVYGMTLWFGMKQLDVIIKVS